MCPSIHPLTHAIHPSRHLSIHCMHLPIHLCSVDALSKWCLDEQSMAEHEHGEHGATASRAMQRKRSREVVSGDVLFDSPIPSLLVQFHWMDMSKCPFIHPCIPWFGFHTHSPIVPWSSHAQYPFIYESFLSVDALFKWCLDEWCLDEQSMAEHEHGEHGATASRVRMHHSFSHHSPTMLIHPPLTRSSPTVQSSIVHLCIYPFIYQSFHLVPW